MALARQCLQPDARSRPSLQQVAERLQAMLAAWQLGYDDLELPPAATGAQGAGEGGAGEGAAAGGAGGEADASAAGEGGAGEGDAPAPPAAAPSPGAEAGAEAGTSAASPAGEGEGGGARASASGQGAANGGPHSAHVALDVEREQGGHGGGGTVYATGPHSLPTGVPHAGVERGSGAFASGQNSAPSGYARSKSAREPVSNAALALAHFVQQAPHTAPAAAPAQLDVQDV